MKAKLPRPIAKNAQNSSLPDLKARKSGQPDYGGRLNVGSYGARSRSNAPAAPASRAKGNARHSYNSVPLNHQFESGDRRSGDKTKNSGAPLSLPNIIGHQEISKMAKVQTSKANSQGHIDNLNQVSPVGESEKYRRLQDAIEIAEEELQVLRQSKIDA